jgi:hypothetical protein
MDYSEYIIEDEVLPEIEIREYLTEEEIMHNNPTFIAMTYDEIVGSISQLVNNEQRAIQFANLHKDVVLRKPTDYLQYIATKVDSTRVKYTDANEDQYISDIQDALKGPHYQLQQSQKNKIAAPFDVNVNITTETTQPIINTESTVVLNSDNVESEDASKIIDTDTVVLPVVAVSWRPLANTSETYVSEYTDVREASTFKEWNRSKDPVILSQWIDNIIKPDFKTTIEHYIKTPLDRHDVALALSHDGKQLDDINEEELDILATYLHELFKEVNNDNTDDDDKPHTGLHAHHKLLKYMSFYKLLSNYNWNTLSEDRNRQLRDLYSNFITQTGDVLEIVNISPSVLYKNIENGQSTLNEVIDHTKRYCKYIDTLRVRALIETLPVVSLEQALMIAEKDDTMIADETRKQQIQKTIKRMIQTEKSIVADETVHLVKHWTEIAEIVKGDDTVNYDGNPNTAPSNTYFDVDVDLELYQPQQPNVNKEETLGSEEDKEINDDVIDSIVVNTSFMQAFPELAKSSVGIREILDVVLPLLLIIRGASAVPWEDANINLWIRQLNEGTVIASCKSRVEKLKEAVPELSDFLAQQLITSKEDTTIKRINNKVINTELAAKLVNVYPVIHNEWAVACRDVLLSALVEYSLHSIELSLKGSLNFSILRGMTKYSHKWSPYGAPLSESKEKARQKTGILFYIAAVAKSVSQHIFTINRHGSNATKAKQIAELMLAMASKEHAERIKALEGIWTTIKDKPVSKNKAELVKISLIEKIDQLKKKDTSNVLAVFLNAFLYLPNLLPKTDIEKHQKRVAWGLGCCTTLLDTAYEAGVDWKNQNNCKALWKIKETLARDTWTAEPRKEYMLFVSSDENVKQISDSKQHESSVHVPMPDPVSQPTQHDQNMYDFMFKAVWFPTQDENALKNEPKVCERYYREHISRVLNTDNARDINSLIDDLKDIDSVYKLVCMIIEDMHLLSKKPNMEVMASRAIESSKNMRDVIRELQNVCKGTTYSTGLYYSKYIMSLVFCLPGTRADNNNGISIDIPGEMSNVLTNRVKKLKLWKKDNKMMTKEEIQEYINTIREKQKDDILDVYNKLSVDEVQILKDIKRFNLKVQNKEERDGEDAGPNQIADVDTDYAGEAEFTLGTSDPDQVNDERLD